jgi:hypothetical protein
LTNSFDANLIKKEPLSLRSELTAAETSSVEDDTITERASATRCKNAGHEAVLVEMKRRREIGRERPLTLFVTPLTIILGLALLSGCIPASAMRVPSSNEAKRLSHPSETQVFKVPRSEAVKGVQQALRANGFVIDRDNRNFILAKESVWSRGWSWDHVAAIYVFEENPATTRISIVINGTPGIFMRQSYATSAAAQAAEAQQMRIQLFEAIRSAIHENQRAAVW